VAWSVRLGLVDLGGADMSSGVIRLSEMRRTKVRPATFDDITGVHVCLGRALQELDTPFPAPDLPYALQALMDLMAQGFMAVATDPAGAIVGVIALDVTSWPWCHPENRAGHYLYNQHFWVDPTQRRGGTGVKLLAWASARADEAGLPLMIEMASLDGNVEEKDAFVQSRGFKYLGGKFFREPNQSS
jgi:GNAT superfamily N-acetyltransferase